MRHPEDGYPGGMFPARELAELDGFAAAWQRMRCALAECEADGSTNEAIVAALFTELLPRLVEQYGTGNVAAMLGRVAGAVARSVESARHVQ